MKQRLCDWQTWKGIITKEPERPWGFRGRRLAGLLSQRDAKWLRRFFGGKRSVSKGVQFRWLIRGRSYVPTADTDGRSSAERDVRRHVPNVEVRIFTVHQKNVAVGDAAGEALAVLVELVDPGVGAVGLAVEEDDSDKCGNHLC
jgi:hypothetical protein